VARLADETKCAMVAWFNDEKNALRSNIGANLSLLARAGRAEIPAGHGIWNLPTTSSTGGITSRELP